MSAVPRLTNKQKSNIEHLKDLGYRVRCSPHDYGYVLMQTVVTVVGLEFNGQPPKPYYVPVVCKVFDTEPEAWLYALQKFNPGPPV